MKLSTVIDATVDKGRAARIACAYEVAEHRPDDADVIEAYGAFMYETMEQFYGLVQSGLHFEPSTVPYANSDAMRADVEKGHLFFFPTTAGYPGRILKRCQIYPLTNGGLGAILSREQKGG